MAYAVKYRCSIKDLEGNDVRADILQDGHSGGITSVTPTDTPLMLEWPSQRGDIFDPVRGAVATLSFYASSVGQFNEFFEGNNKEYRLDIYVSSSIYWRGYLMLQDYQESLSFPPYIVTVKAYDLGFLKNVEWDITDHEDDTVLDAVYKIIANSIANGVIERVNLYEDSISSGASDSMLDQINIHQDALIDDSWIGINMYEALGRLLRPFSSFIFQENGNWNICRIPDMSVSHNQRTYAFPKIFLSSGSEDTRSDLSNYKERSRSAVLLSCPNYRKLGLTYDVGSQNIVNNGTAQNLSADAEEYWTPVSSIAIGYTSRLIYGGAPTIVGESQRAMYLRDTASATHDVTYNVPVDTIFDVSYGYAIYKNFGLGMTATNVTIEIKLVGTSTYYLNMSTGAWSTSSSVSQISFSSTGAKKWSETTLQTDLTPVAGVLSVTLYDANWTSSVDCYTYYSLSIVPALINKGTVSSVSYKETIDADSLEDQNETAIYFGDPTETVRRDLLRGALTIASSGAATDAWGPGGFSLLDILQTNYRDQFSSVARRIQANFRGDFDYATVLRDSSDRVYLASNFTKDFRRIENFGEWIEIKTNRLLDSLVSVWELDETSGTNVSDSLSGYDGTNNGATVNQSGKIGTAYDFDGLNDYISMPEANFRFDPRTESYTVSVWVNSSDPTPGAGNAHIAGMWTGSTDPYPFIIRAIPSLSDEVTCGLYDGSTTFEASIDGADVWDGSWHLISFVVDHSNTTAYAYLDGILKDSVVYTFPSFTYSGTYYFHVGTNQSAAPIRWYDGLMDQITIHNRALGVNEVLFLANGVPYTEFGI